MPDGIVCFLFCFGSVAAPVKVPPVDTFCKVYQRQVVTKEDYEAVQGVAKAVLDRMQYNDLYYLCKCKAWKGKECASTQR